MYHGMGGFMKLKEIYQLAIKVGIEADPRGKKEIDQFLQAQEEKYKRLPPEEKEFFDQERLTNPYSDTRVLTGDMSAQVKVVLAGVDLEVGEILLADRLREKGQRIDLLLAHHPEGSALAALAEVMPMQAEIWYKYGVPINIGEALMGRRMKEVFRTLMPVNHNRAVDVARLLGLPFICVHTPADNLVTSFLQKMFNRKPPYNLRELISQLRTIPEFQSASRFGFGPTILVGDGEKRAGKILVDMTGGTEGPKEAIEKLADAGVGTLVGMHMGEKTRKQAEKFNVNVVIAGHIPSDSLGMNLFLDKLEEKGLKILTCSGLERVSRVIY